ncbi:uncharacterized protein N7483_006183 [Penicillium malachiteum]|uniref:uncharacterized protein n=1 Tax=Penicillium malachiteum TaxID=1324776 RepID=UPI002547885D|nr:uncharacterized protein N7483_006183 [Penicillium malachiteum]KAJ5731675.1 hypothetical protein N7483_006183 [Penicillium malachiteum]
MVSYVSGFPELPGFIQGFIQEPDCQNDSLFDKLGKRIEDWRRVSLEPLNFCHPQERKESTPEFVPTLLYLRANQLRGLLLRPFFWGKPHLRSNDEKIKLGLELATDSIFILSDLDINSATYRRQIATFQHFLSSSVVLLILSIVHALDETGSDSTLSHSLDDIEILVSRAIDLIASYRDHPASSHELSRKLSPMLTMLKKFRIPGRDRLATIDTEFSKTPPDDFNIIENSNSLLSQPEGIVQPLQQGNEADDVFSFFDMNFPTSDHEYDLNQFDWTGCSFDMRSWDTITEMFLSNLE